MRYEYEKLEALFLKLYEDWNDSYSNVHVFYKTPELRFSRSVSKDGGWKVARWLHSLVKWLYIPAVRPRCLSSLVWIDVATVSFSWNHSKCMLLLYTLEAPLLASLSLPAIWNVIFPSRRTACPLILFCVFWEIYFPKSRTVGGSKKGLVLGHLTQKPPWISELNWLLCKHLFLGFILVKTIPNWQNYYEHLKWELFDLWDA